MPLAGHLRELRRRLLWVVLVFGALSVVCFLFIDVFVDLALAISPGFSFVYLAPSELVTSYMKLALALGLVFSLPFILWQIWAFVQPGLTEREERAARPAMIAGVFFFLLGIVFCYFAVLPMTLRFFYNFNGSQEIQASISFNNYLNFLLGMLAAFGLVFEMPPVSFILARLGIVKPSTLVKGRKYAVLIIFIAAAIITPPDAVSQIMTAIPMVGLYEISILSARAAAKSRAEAGAEDEK
ncbi:MAG: twin-arginine translocase subunit TatC [Oscillospiraceae bacterium]|nr:twin-arginine translocase subunit TatC [Oscillospiraceae bacterium]